MSDRRPAPEMDERGSLAYLGCGVALGWVLALGAVAAWLAVS